MLEERPFIRLEQTIDKERIQQALAELYSKAFWSDYASYKLKSDQRRTAVMKRFPAPPVDKEKAAKGVTAYYAPKEWADQCVETLNFQRLPVCMGIVNEVMALNGWTKLGIALVSELEPGGTIPEHSDDGEYFDLMHRVQIPLIANGTCRFIIDGETRVLQEGEVWIIDNRRKHSVYNDGPGNRVNLYFDAI